MTDVDPTPLDIERRLLAAIVASSDDAIIGKDPAGLVTSWNAAAERMFGYSAEEMIGRPIAVLAVDGRADEMPAILRRVMGGERVDHFETQRRHKSGATVHVSLTISPIRDDSGRVFGASKVARDITAARRLAEALQSAQDRLREQHRELLHAARLGEMGQMAATLAHEINQPLSAIASYLQACELLLAADTPESRSTLRDALARANKQAVRAGEVVRRLRSFAQPHEERLAPVAIAGVLEESAALAALEEGPRGVSLELYVENRVAMVVADRVEIQQVLLNLMRNAVEAMEGRPSRQLRLSTVHGPREIEVVVSDNGPGLTPQVRATLFKPFCSTKTNGMGIGLSICRKIVEAHGGRLWAGDRAGGGAEFHFTLRRAPSN